VVPMSGDSAPHPVARTSELKPRAGAFGKTLLSFIPSSPAAPGGEEAGGGAEGSPGCGFPERAAGLSDAGRTEPRIGEGGWKRAGISSGGLGWGDSSWEMPPPAPALGVRSLPTLAPNDPPEL